MRAMTLAKAKGKKTAQPSSTGTVSRLSGRPRRLALGAATMTIATVVAGALLLIGVQSSKAPLADAEQRVAQRASSLAAAAASSFAAVDTRLQRLVRLLEGKEKPAGGRVLDAGTMIASTAEGLPQVRNLLFIDGNGSVVAGMKPLGKGPGELRQLRFYSAHQGRVLGLFVGNPELLAPGEWRIAVSRRVTRSGGDFGGVVVAFIDPQQLRPSFYQTADSEELESALITPAGEIVFSSLTFAGAAIDQAPINSLIEGVSDAGVVNARLRPEGDDFVTASVPVEGWPLVAIANVDQAKLLADSEGVFRNMLTAAIAVLAAAGLITVALLIVTPQRRPA